MKSITEFRTAVKTQQTSIKKEAEEMEKNLPPPSLFSQLVDGFGTAKATIIEKAADATSVISDKDSSDTNDHADADKESISSKRVKFTSDVLSQKDTGVDLDEKAEEDNVSSTGSGIFSTFVGSFLTSNNSGATVGSAMAQVGNTYQMIEETDAMKQGSADIESKLTSADQEKSPSDSWDKVSFQSIEATIPFQLPEEHVESSSQSLAEKDNTNDATGVTEEQTNYSGFFSKLVGALELPKATNEISKRTEKNSSQVKPTTDSLSEEYTEDGEDKKTVEEAISSTNIVFSTLIFSAFSEH